MNTSATWVYLKTQDDLYTVGFYHPDGSWEPESDHGEEIDASLRVRFLNGGYPFGWPEFLVRSKRPASDYMPQGGAA